MKAVDIASKLIQECANPLTIGDVLYELVKETHQLIQFRHAQKDESIKAVIDEVNNKWHVVVKLLAKRNYPDMNLIDENTFMDRIKLEKAPSIQRALEDPLAKKTERIIRKVAKFLLPY